MKKFKFEYNPLVGLVIFIIILFSYGTYQKVSPERAKEITKAPIIEKVYRA